MSTLTFTTGTDVLAEATGNDLTATAATGTINAADNVDAGDGTNTLSATLTNGEVTGAATLKNFGTIFLAVSSTDQATFTATNVSSSTLKPEVGSDAKLTLTNVSVNVDGTLGDNNGANFVTAIGSNSLSLSGGTGNDSLTGASGSDTLTGGGGLDTLTGGAGSDTFAFAPRNSRLGAVDIITDFAAGDQITLTGEAYGTLTGGLSAGDGSNLLPNSVQIGSFDGTYTTIYVYVTQVTSFPLGAVDDSDPNARAPAQSEIIGPDQIKLLGNYTAGTFKLTQGATNILTYTPPVTVVNPVTTPSTLTVTNASGQTIQVGSLADFVAATAASGATSATAQVDTAPTTPTLTMPTNLQNLVVTGSGDVNIVGNDLNNYLQANLGSDTLVGGTGRDMLVSGSGLNLAPTQTAALAGTDTVDGSQKAATQVAALADTDPAATDTEKAAAQAATATGTILTGDTSGAVYRHGFDRAYYLAANPDVAASGIDPLLHYQLYGSSERRAINAYGDTTGSLIANDLKDNTGLDKSVLFNAQSYLAAYPDVATSGLDPLTHFRLIGAAQGRSPYGFTVQPALFDAAWYLGQNPDVAKAGVNAWQHYSTFGWREGRNPGPGFDQNAYLAANPDVKAAGINPLLQYELYGAAEGRSSKIVTDADTFAFGDGSGHSTITDFRNSDGDQLTIKRNVNSSGLLTQAGLVAASVQVGSDVLVNLGSGNDVRLLNVSLADLAKAKVSFV